MTYIDRDPETLAAQEKKAKREKLDKDDEERMMEFINQQVERGKESGDTGVSEAAPFFRPEDTPLTFELKIKPKVKPIIVPPKELQEPSTSSDSKSKVRKEESSSRGKKRSHEERKREEREEKPKTKKSGWLLENLVVKVMTKKLGDKYYKAKGVVTEIMDNGFVGSVKLKSPEEVEGHVVKLDQEHLETVIPGIGKEVIVLSGKHKLRLGKVEKVRIEEFCVDLEIEGEIVKRIPYEHICKCEF